MKIILNALLGKLGLRLVRKKTWEEMQNLSFFYWNDPFLQLFKDPEKIKSLVPFSKSQIKQDLFVLQELDFKEDGFFVEIGAANGVQMSNTWLLEKQFKWKGILAEPSQKYKHSLPSNRSSIIDSRLVWNLSGEKKEFMELGDSGLSTASEYAQLGLHGTTRLNSRSKTYLVDTVSLNDLLKEHKAPVAIDYISIDTEGSELKILEAFDFSRWRVRIFTIEHNYEDRIREDIYNLLTSKGYTRKFINISHQDDWYVLATSI